MTICLLGSAVALAVAPAFMPDTYSWLSNTTSESAAQGLAEAWLARLGFALFGVGVIWLARHRSTPWGRWGVALHIAFGTLMLAAAVFSNRPIEPGVAVDTLEDTLHSVAATMMGFAFASGVVVVGLRRDRWSVRAIDVAAVVASVIIPLGMTVSPGAAGLLQRTMFLIAYGWYLMETWRPVLVSGSSQRLYQVGT